MNLMFSYLINVDKLFCSHWFDLSGQQLLRLSCEIYEGTNWLSRYYTLPICGIQGYAQETHITGM